MPSEFPLPFTPLVAEPVPSPHGDARPGSVLLSVDVAAVSDAPWPGLREQLLASDALHSEEVALADALPGTRRPLFVAGRVAMRAAMRQALRASDVAPPPVLRTPRGAPHLPDALTGSISHKGTRALAGVLSRASDVQHFGIDLERRPTVSKSHAPSIASRILTAKERDALATYDQAVVHAHGGDEPHAARLHRERTLLYFAIKEAIYKAIDPFVERYVRFTEVEVALHDDGTTAVTLALPELSPGDVHVDAWWRMDDDWIVATAVSRR